MLCYCQLPGFDWLGPRLPAFEADFDARATNRFLTPNCRMQVFLWDLQGDRELASRPPAQRRRATVFYPLDGARLDPSPRGHLGTRFFAPQARNVGSKPLSQFRTPI